MNLLADFAIPFLAAPETQGLFSTYSNFTLTSSHG